MSEPAITKRDVAALARYADLPLSEERQQAILPILQSWVPAANELNRRMAEDEVRGQIPCTIFAFGNRA